MRRPTSGAALLASLLLAAALGACGDGDGGGDGDGDATVDPTTTTVNVDTTAGPAAFGLIEDTFAGGPGPSVVILGDSLTVDARDRLHELLNPDHPTKIGAIVGEGFAGGPFTAALGAEEPAMQEAALHYGEAGADVVVVALGTNDAWLAALTLDDSLAGLREIVGRFPDSCVVAVELNTWSGAEDYDVEEAVAITEELRQHADALVASLQPGQTLADQIHANDEGREALASGIAEAVADCPT